MPASYKLASHLSIVADETLLDCVANEVQLRHPGLKSFGQPGNIVIALAAPNGCRRGLLPYAHEPCKARTYSLHTSTFDMGMHLAVFSGNQPLDQVTGRCSIKPKEPDLSSQGDHSELQHNMDGNLQSQTAKRKKEKDREKKRRGREREREREAEREREKEAEREREKQRERESESESDREGQAKTTKRKTAIL